MLSSGQTMLTVGALILMVITNLNMIRTTSTSGYIVLRSKMGLAAISAATSLIEEAQRKKFDEADASDSAITSLSKCTAPSALGPEGTEAYPNFDDFDDFNNLKTHFESALPETLWATCSVVYVNPTSADSTSPSRTWYKKLTVKVISQSLIDTVKQSFVYSYWILD